LHWMLTFTSTCFFTIYMTTVELVPGINILV
jgi:hypothetical protein